MLESKTKLVHQYEVIVLRPDDNETLIAENRKRLMQIFERLRDYSHKDSSSLEFFADSGFFMAHAISYNDDHQRGRLNTQIFVSSLDSVVMPNSSEFPLIAHIYHISPSYMMAIGKKHLISKDSFFEDEFLGNYPQDIIDIMVNIAKEEKITLNCITSAEMEIKEAEKVEQHKKLNEALSQNLQLINIVCHTEHVDQTEIQKTIKLVTELYLKVTCS